MNRPLASALLITTLGFGTLGCAGAPFTEPTSAAVQFKPLDDAPESTGGLGFNAEATFSFGQDLVVDVQVLMSEPLEALQGGGPVRFVHMVADFNVNHLWVSKSDHYGPLDTRSSETIDLSSPGVNVGLAKFMAAQILGQSEAHPYVRELTGPCHVSVKPKAGKTWGTVARSADIEIAASMVK